MHSHINDDVLVYPSLGKCQFFEIQLHYLGHKISADGLEPLPEKLKAITNLAPTKNVDEACQILGLLGYYMSFTPTFADITTPITNLLKKSIPFVWSKQCQDALDYLKEIFYSKPILQFPDTTKDYMLYTDASNNAYSGVLCQQQSNDNDIRPVAYFSGTFTAQNKSYYATEKKSICCVKKCSKILLLSKRHKAYSKTQPQTPRVISVQRHEDCKFG